MAKVATDGGSITGDLAAAIRWAVDTIARRRHQHLDRLDRPDPGAADCCSPTSTRRSHEARAKGVLVTVANGNGIGNTGSAPGDGAISSNSSSLDVLAVGAAGARGRSGLLPARGRRAVPRDASRPRSRRPVRRLGGTSFSSPLHRGLRRAAAARRGRAPARPSRRTASRRWSSTAPATPSIPPTWEGYGVIDEAQLDAAVGHARAGTLPARPSPDANAVYVEQYQQNVRRVSNGELPEAGGGLRRR